MPNINKTSVCNELDQLKTDDKKRSDADLIPKENQLLSQGFFILLELILAISLEKQNTKTSKNASKPSSQTDKMKHPPSRAVNSKEEKKTKQQLTIPVLVSALSFCATCDEDISKQPSHRHERRTGIDIQFEKVIDQIKTCDSCHAETKAAFLSDLQGKMQYGNGIKAYVINLAEASSRIREVVY